MQKDAGVEIEAVSEVDSTVTELVVRLVRAGLLAEEF